MSNDDSPDRNGFERMISDEREQIHTYRRLIHQGRLGNGVSSDLHDAFAAEILSYHDTLREFRESPTIDADDFPDIEPLRSRAGRQVEVETPSKRLGKKTTFKEVPAVRELNISYLLRVSYQLDDVAQQLGFGADAAKSTPHNEADTGDLKALLEARGQDDAVEKLPRGGSR